MTRLKGLLREPALLIDFAETLLVLLIAFGLSVNGDQQNYIIAALIAFAALAKGFTTTPFPVSVVPDFGRAVLVLAVSFGLDVSADQTAILVTFLGTLTTLVMRAQITPRKDPVIAQAGSGSGPVTEDGPVVRGSGNTRVRGEDGYATLGYIGFVILLVAVVVAVLNVLSIVAVSWFVLLVVALIGAVLVIADNRTGGPRTRV